MKLERVTAGELAILQVLWQRGEATSREITEAIHEEVTDPKISSVQKLIERLDSKGCIRRDRSRRAHLFRPRVSREDFLQNRLQTLADDLCGGALAPLVTTLLRARGGTPAERDELRRLVDSLWSDTAEENMTQEKPRSK
jgi:BlaI family transcriptional regulator, penicillinase repressor